jgi:hypothetical protein
VRGVRLAQLSVDLNECEISFGRKTNELIPAL